MEVKFIQFLNKIVAKSIIGRLDVNMNLFSYIKQELKNHKYLQAQN